MNSTCDPVKGCQVTAQCARASDCNPGACQTAACTSGKCVISGCAEGLKCCAGGCKACCGDADCNNDGISCTNDTCNGGLCSHQADNNLCPASTPTCDPAHGGCIQCTNDSECDDKSDCTQDSCDLTKHTCVNKAGVCAKNGLLCCGTTCAACCNNADCGIAVGTAATPIGKVCPTPICDAGKCTTKTVTCSLGYCCATGCCTGIQPN